ncbi:DUF1254-domain-containing protein [Mycena venus]|uniref:DUF1254-domain-containing protein n=1 Tax=Mycena venus TaxID=2733690 RepID=A0A8H6YEG3_9AGAR|nr:DUF1254-domain-containing protein [Mycena venus]
MEYLSLSLSLTLACLGNAALTAIAQNATAEALVVSVKFCISARTCDNLRHACHWSVRDPYAKTFTNPLTNWTANLLHHNTALDDASNRLVALPNVDTLYSLAVLHLSAGEVVTTMPAWEGRFYVWPFYDLYANNVCNIGTITNSTAGKYLIKCHPSDPGCVSEPERGDYAGLIYLPMVYGLTLLRIEVGNTSDTTHVVCWIQPEFSLSPIPSHGNCGAPALTKALLADNLTVSNALLYTMQLLARFAEYNPPEVSADVPHIAATLKAAGISTSAKKYTQPAHVNLTQAYSDAQAVATAVKTIPADFVSLGGGWGTPAPALSGDLHSHYDMRAFIAIQGYLQLQASRAVSPSFASPSGTLYTN